MAQVIHAHESSPIIDHVLERLLTFWRTVPEQATEWPEWDEDSRLDFILEWPIMRGAYWRMMATANAGVLNESQQSKWQELTQLIETHRATVEWMLEGPI